MANQAVDGNGRTEPSALLVFCKNWCCWSLEDRCDIKMLCEKLNKVLGEDNFDILTRSENLQLLQANSFSHVIVVADKEHENEIKNIFNLPVISNAKKVIAHWKRKDLLSSVNPDDSFFIGDILEAANIDGGFTAKFA